MNITSRTIWPLIKRSILYSALAFTAGMVLYIGPLISVIVAETIYKSQNILATTVENYLNWIWLVILFVLQTIAGYHSQKILGKKAWLNGTLMFFIFTIGLLPFLLLLRNQPSTLISGLINDPTPLLLAALGFGAFFGGGQLIGGIIASFKKQ
jgi:hypothetical protein